MPTIIIVNRTREKKMRREIAMWQLYRHHRRVASPASAWADTSGLARDSRNHEQRQHRPRSAAGPGLARTISPARYRSSGCGARATKPSAS
jgi:hypothetical protein